MTPRRELSLAVTGTVLAGGAGLLAAARPWLELTVTRGAPLPSVTRELTGGTLAPLVSALSIVALAGVVGVYATRSWGRWLVGLLLAGSGAGVLAAALPWLTAPSAVRAGAVALDSGLPAGDAVARVAGIGPGLAVLAGALGALVGAAVVLRGRQWPAMGARYEKPAGGVPEVPGSVGADVTPRADEAVRTPAPLPESDAADAAVWDALDRGEDPTRR